MALRDEHADILGGPILQRPESGLFATFSHYHFVFKSVTLLGLSLVVWIVCARGLEHLRKLRELRYRKAMRRKHGIPDSDCRPFAVAYAAAKRTHLEREAQHRKKMTNNVSDHSLPAIDQRTDAQKDARGLRRRVPENAVQPHDHPLHGRRVAPYNDKRSESHSLDFVNRYNPNPRSRMTFPEPLPVERHPVRHSSRKDLVINIDNNEESRKRSLEDESDVEYEIMKKSRIDQDELKGVGERADSAQFGKTSRRASKESLSRRPEGAFIYANGQKRYEDVNGFQDESHELVDEAMEGIDEDGATELEAMARGKKRDRVEAGSSFGGDEEEEDIRSGRVSRHRKRRTVLRRNVEAPARGQKRDRESGESEGEEGDSETSRRRVQRRSKKKRGKKAASDEITEISVEDPRISRDPLCGGRRIGDDWEADGVQYKVGDKGKRLRLTLIKKARNKYHMPQDSQHPDRSAALEIYVETWMTDEQYKCAEERQELAWQEAPGEPSGPKTLDVDDSPMKNGKDLLWDSVRGSPARPLRQFLPSGTLTRINPFEQLQPTLGRRVASSSAIASPILSGVIDSPARPGFRGFSKWEKQDREADALARIRAKIEDQKKSHAPQKLPEIPASASAPELGAKPLSIPTITLTPAPAVAADGHVNNPSIPQSKPNASISFATSPTTNDSVKGAVAVTTSGFSLPSTSMPATTSPTLFPSAPTVPTTASSTLPPPFSFGKPSQVPLSTSTSTLSSTVPKPFEKGSQPQPASMESTSKPQLSSFAKPISFSFTSPATAAASSTTKPQAPDGASTPSPATSTLAVAKGEALVPPPVLTSTTAFDNSKPPTPLFSFSGASSSTATTQPPTAPKFSFTQPPVASTFASSPSLASGVASQAKPVFKFGQTPTAKDGESPSMVSAADETKKSAMPMLVFGPQTGSNEPIKFSSFETPSTSGSSSSPSVSAANFFAKPVTVDGSASTSTPLKPTLAPTSITTANNILSSAPSGTTASGNAPVFTFGGTNSGSKTGEGSKPASLFGGGSNTMPIFAANSTEKKPTFTFAAPASEGSKPIPIFGGNAEGLKPPVFGGSAGSSARSRGGM